MAQLRNAAHIAATALQQLPNIAKLSISTSQLTQDTDRVASLALNLEFAESMIHSQQCQIDQLIIQVNKLTTTVEALTAAQIKAPYHVSQLTLPPEWLPTPAETTVQQWINKLKTKGVNIESKEIIELSGQSHAPTFTARVTVCSHTYIGIGARKQDALNNAYEQARSTINTYLLEHVFHHQSRVTYNQNRPMVRPEHSDKYGNTNGTEEYSIENHRVVRQRKRAREKKEKGNELNERYLAIYEPESGYPQCLRSALTDLDMLFSTRGYTVPHGTKKPLGNTLPSAMLTQAVNHYVEGYGLVDAHKLQRLHDQQVTHLDYPTSSPQKGDGTRSFLIKTWSQSRNNFVARRLRPLRFSIQPQAAQPSRWSRFIQSIKSRFSFNPVATHGQAIGRGFVLQTVDTIKEQFEQVKIWITTQLSNFNITCPVLIKYIAVGILLGIVGTCSYYLISWLFPVASITDPNAIVPQPVEPDSHITRTFSMSYLSELAGSMSSSLSQRYQSFRTTDWQAELKHFSSFTLHLRNIETFMSSLMSFGKKAIDYFARMLTGQSWFQTSRDVDVFRQNVKELTTFILDYDPKTLTALTAANFRKKYKEAQLLSLALSRSNEQSHERMILGQALARGFDIYNQASEYATIAQSRQKPVFIYFHGQTAQGKTAAKEELVNAVYQKLYDSPLPHEKLYRRTTGSQFWDGYHNPFAVVFDEFLQSIIPETRSQEVFDIITAVNDEPWRLPMAAINDKSNTFFQPHIVIVTTNSEAFPSNTAVESPPAFYRRRDFVVTTTLKPGAVRKDSIGVEDCRNWSFTLTNTNAVGDPSSATTEPNVEFDDLVNRVYHRVLQYARAYTHKQIPKDYYPLVGKPQFFLQDMHSPKAVDVAQRVVPPLPPVYTDPFFTEPTGFEIDGSLSADALPTDDDDDEPTVVLSDEPPIVHPQCFGIGRYCDEWKYMFLCATRALDYPTHYWENGELKAYAYTNSSYPRPHGPMSFQQRVSVTYRSANTLPRDNEHVASIKWLVHHPYARTFPTFVDTTHRIDILPCLRNRNDYYGPVSNSYYVQDWPNLYTPTQAHINEAEEFQACRGQSPRAPVPSLLGRIFDVMTSYEMLCTALTVGCLVPIIIAWIKILFRKKPVFFKKQSKHPGTEKASKTQQHRIKQFVAEKKIIQNVVSIHKQVGIITKPKSKYDKLAANVFQVFVPETPTQYETFFFCTFLCTNIFATALHGWQFINDHFYLLQVHNQTAANCFKINPSDCFVKELPDRDLVLVTIPPGHWNMMRSLKRQLGETLITEPIRGATRLGWDQANNVPHNHTGSLIHILPKMYGEISQESPTPTICHNMYKLEEGRGEDGDCGQPYFLDNDTVTTYLLGIHTGRHINSSIIAPILRKDLLDFIASMPPEMAEAASWTMAEPESFEDVRVRLQVKFGSFCGIRQVYETSKPAYIPSTTNLVPTPFVKGINSTQGFLPPPFPVNNLPAALTKTALRKSFRKVAQKKWQFVKYLEDPMMWAGVFTSDMPSHAWQPLTIEQAMFGVPELGNCHSIAMDTSLGWPYVQDGYTKPMLIVKPGPHNEGFIHQRIRQVVLRRQALALLRKMLPTFFTWTLKDETRPRQRVEEELSRGFQASPIDSVLYEKMYYGRFVSFLERTRDHDVQVGLNPYSMDWTILAKRLLTYGDDVLMAGDVDGSDIRIMCLAFAHHFHKHYVRFFSYMDEETKLQTYSAIMSGSHPFVVVREIVIVLLSMASGRWSTSWFNSVIYSVTGRVCYHVSCLRAKVDPSFFEFDKWVIQLIFGDDYNGSRHKLVTWWNNNIRKQLFEEIFFMTITAPNKNLTVPDNYSLKEIDFLCRTFVPYKGIFLAPLNSDAMRSSVQWVMKNDQCTPYEQCVSNCESALFEFVLHGELVYETHRVLFNKFIVAMGFPQRQVHLKHAERIRAYIETHVQH